MDRTIAMSNTADPSTGPSPCPLAPCRAFCLIAGVTYFWEFNVCRNAERSAWKAVAPVMTVICKSPAQLKRITASFSRSGMDPCEIQRTTRTKDRSASRDRLFFFQQSSRDLRHKHCSLATCVLGLCPTLLLHFHQVRRQTLATLEACSPSRPRHLAINPDRRAWSSPHARRKTRSASIDSCSIATLLMGLVSSGYECHKATKRCTRSAKNLSNTACTLLSASVKAIRPMSNFVKSGSFIIFAPFEGSPPIIPQRVQNL